jgi:BirA family biotin operon repressor/biotin-[acetyl-CoA-carboxylase] ligase
MFYRFEELTSSNDEVRGPSYREGDWVVVERQSAGRGQRGHHWLSPEGLNLTASLLLKPTFLPVARQFQLLQVVTLGLCDMLSDYGIDARIKWTNDIYVGDKKLVGILIEHSLSGAHLSRTVVGIGLNINQTEFDPALPNPTSMALLTGRTFDREEVLGRLDRAMMSRYEMLRQGELARLEQEYHHRLYRLEQWHPFRLASGERFEGRIRGVCSGGGLRIGHPDGAVRSYLFREVEFLIPTRDPLVG